MILVDTSVWVDHLRTGNRQLAALLEAGQVFGSSIREQASWLWEIAAA